MAKFCTKCGKPLKDGKPCECEKKEKETVVEKKPTNIGEQILETFKGAFQKPYTTMKETANESYIWTSIIAMVASAVGLTMVFIKTLKIIYAQSINTMSSAVGLGNLSGMTSLNVDIPKTFLMIVLLLAVFYAVYTLVAYISTNKIQHKENSYKKIIASMAVPAMVSTVFSVGSWILMAVLGLFGFFGVSAGMTLATFYRYQALMVSTKVDKDRAGYVILAATLIAAIALGIVVAIMGVATYMNNSVSPTINGLNIIQFIK